MVATKKRPEPAERACMAYHFKDGSSQSLPLVKILLANIRQWVAIEKLEVSTPDQFQARESARAKLRKVAELAINAEAALFAATEGGRKDSEE